MNILHIAIPPPPLPTPTMSCQNQGHGLRIFQKLNVQYQASYPVWRQVLFDLVILLICRRCHTFARLLMLTVRGDCGHLKASWDNHINCLFVFLVLLVLDILHVWYVEIGLAKHGN